MTKKLRRKRRGAGKLNTGRSRDAADTLAAILRGMGLKPVREFVAIPGRRYRFDIAFPEKQVLVEVHGSTFTDGRHVRGEGFNNDREKMNLAQLEGFYVLEFTTWDMRNRLSYIVEQIERALS